MLHKGARIDFDAVKRQFGSLIAVNDVSLSIHEGEFFTLLGPSGSGKTTLLQLLAGFQDPDQGQILLDGHAVSGLPPFKREIGVVFQSYALFPNMTVFDNVAFPLRVRRTEKGELKKRVGDALRLVELQGLETRKPSQLSGGQMQRVAFARAIVFNPRLLLMDEPLAALDAKLRRSMRSEIKALQQKLGVTVVYVTHDQDEALAMSDRIAVMNRGNIEQLASPYDLYETPRSRFVADFLGEANVLEGTVVAQNDDFIMEVSVGQNRFRARSRERLIVGTKVAVIVRPEKVNIAAQIDDINAVNGRVISRVYGGDHTLFRVSVGNTTISAKIPLAASTLPSSGDDVRVGWALDSATVLTQ